MLLYADDANVSAHHMWSIHQKTVAFFSSNYNQHLLLNYLQHSKTTFTWLDLFLSQKITLSTLIHLQSNHTANFKILYEILVTRLNWFRQITSIYKQALTRNLAITNRSCIYITRSRYWVWQPTIPASAYKIHCVLITVTLLFLAK